MSLDLAGISAAYHNISLDLVGLLALADTDAVALRTVLTDSSSWLDTLILCPGLHRQHKAESLSNGEYPACAAMTTGYVFRVENPATVHFLQKIGRTGRLTTLSVSKQNEAATASSHTSAFPAALSVITMACLVSLEDWLALSYLCLLAVVRIINTAVIRRRSKVGWHGSDEPGQTGDLLVLLSYDRWVRIRGYTNDLKAVVSGRWLHEPGLIDECMIGTSTFLAYLAPTLVANATRNGQFVVALLVVASAAMLSMINRSTTFLSMKQRVLRLDGERKAYKSRSELARELISQSGRNDWACAMGLITPEPSKTESNLQGPVVI